MATSSPGDRHRILGIEVCRGVAAILVILYHVSRHVDSAYKAPLLKSVLQFGHAGVDLFFVISGFIILYVHYDDVGNPKQLARYIRRRLTRIFPTYWVALALTIAMMFHHGVFTAADLFWSAFLLPSDRPLILGIAWTLRFEILFYAMFCVTILHRGAGFALLAGWFALSGFCAASGTKIGFLPDQFQSAFVLEFLFGMVAAFLAKEQFVHGRALFLRSGCRCSRVQRCSK
ncbi:MAG TPA: acyltransferase [Pseudolabrys sp.]|nr:acyltransferase [Pseudolabrys sp.]